MAARLALSSFRLQYTADNVTAIEFDSTGNYLATGDRGGRIVVFKGVVKSTKAHVTELRLIDIGVNAS